MIDRSVAEFSNAMVYGALAVYALALVAFAVCFAARRDGVIAAPAGSKMVTGRQRETSASGDAGTVAVLAPEQEPPESHPVPGRKAGNIALSLMWLATVFLAVAVVTRGVSAGRAPWGNMYEFSCASALAVALVYLGISTRRDVRWLGVLVTGAVLLTLGLAVTVLYVESAQLVPALKSWWLVIHVSAAIICGGAFTVAAFLTVLYLCLPRDSEGGGRVRRWLAARVPSAERLDTLSYRILMFAFPLWTFAVIAGAIWAESAWGRYWGWDPKETWAFITWVVYAAYLHARATAGWRGRKAAAISLAGYLTFIFNYFVINLFASGLHSYGGLS